MAFPLDDQQLGAPSYGRRKGTEGIIWHTTEGAGTSRADAVATARWQATSGNTSGGSYNFIIYDGGILLTVPYLEASGGVNPGSIAWAPERYPFLREGLTLGAYRDPNAYLLNVAFSGKTSVFRAGGMPQSMVDTAAALVRWVETWTNRVAFQCGHMHWQTNRTDPSQVVLDRITQSEEPMDWVSRMKPLAPYICVTDPNSMTRNAPTLSSPAQFLHANPVELTIVGEVAGDSVGGSSRWLCYTSSTWGLGCTHESNEDSRKELAGFTQADLDKATSVGRIDMHTKAIAQAESNLAAVKALR